MRSSVLYETLLISSGFMKQLPNLLKQESSSAATYVNILLRMYNDPRPSRTQSKDSVEQALIPYERPISANEPLITRLCIEILQSFNTLDESTQQRNISAWRSTVSDVLIGFSEFSEPDVCSSPSALTFFLTFASSNVTSI